MDKIEKAKTDDLGVKISGSAKTGHKIALAVNQRRILNR